MNESIINESQTRVFQKEYLKKYTLITLTGTKNT